MDSRRRLLPGFAVVAVAGIGPNLVHYPSHVHALACLW